MEHVCIIINIKSQSDLRQNRNPEIRRSRIEKKKGKKWNAGAYRQSRNPFKNRVQEKSVNRGGVASQSFCSLLFRGKRYTARSEALNARGKCIAPDGLAVKPILASPPWRHKRRADVFTLHSTCRGDDSENNARWQRFSSSPGARGDQQGTPVRILSALGLLPGEDGGRAATDDNAARSLPYN